MHSGEHVSEQIIEGETASFVNEYNAESFTSGTIYNSENMQDMEEGPNIYTTGSRPPKRNRQLDQEEEWTTVTRGGKRLARSHEQEESSKIPEHKIEVSITSTSEEKLPKQFMLAKIFKMELIKDITRVKYVNAYKVLIQFSNDESADKLIESKYLNENGYKCQRTFDIKDTYGVIKNIDLDSTEEEILGSLSCDIPIIGIRRLKRRNGNNGQWEPSEVIRICFKGTRMPAKVYIYDTVSSVSPYEYPVTQCARCWRYGHTIRVCPSNKVICPKCSGHHDNCDATAFKCSNCQGIHMALSRTCSIYKKEKRIRQLMAEFNCSYKKALTIYVPPEPTVYQREPEDTSEASAENEDKNEHNTEASSSSTHANKTYADILKEATKGSSKSKQEKNNTKDKRQKDKYKSKRHEETDCFAENQDDYDQKTEEEGTNSEDNKVMWRKILQQLKDKIFDNKLTIEEKIKMCAKIFFEAIKQSVLNYLTNLPLFSFIKQWVTDINT